MTKLINYVNTCIAKTPREPCMHTEFTWSPIN